MKKIKEPTVSEVITGLTKNYFNHVFSRLYNNQEALLAFKLYVL